jgi:SAM-dependent methyltransferase
MKDAGWSVKGIEINDSARHSSIETYGLEVIGPDQLPDLEKHSFDCITLWHVLEHFHDPRDYLARLRELLKPGGTMIIAVPNIVSADAVYYGSYWAALDVPRHLWHFSPATLRLLAGKTGFNVTGMRILPLDVFYIGMLSEKYRGRSFSFFRAVLKAKWFTLKTVFNRENASSLVYFLRKANDQ